MILIRTFFLAFWLVGLGFAQSVSVLDSSLTLSVTGSPRSKAYFTNHTARGTWQAGINFNYDHAAQAWVKYDTLSRIYQEIDGEERFKQNMRLRWNEDQQGWIDTLYFSLFNEWGNGIKHVIFLHGNGNRSLTTYTADQLVDSTYSYQYDDQGNTWFHQSLSVRSYDADGNLTEILQQDWDTSASHSKFVINNS